MLLFKPDWKILEKLRQQFLLESFSSASYWETKEVLEQYDQTFGKRIGWKWASVLEEVATPSLFETGPISLIDWGCGTGVASRSFLDRFGTKFVQKLFLLDKSSLAAQFATDRILKPHPNLKIETSLLSLGQEKKVLLISHVLNELSGEAEKELVGLIKKVDWVIWVEPGTPNLSRKLIGFREALRNDFRVIAPCPHQDTCGLLKKKDQAHWCHFFATPPSDIFRDPFWSEFSKRLKIDLRSLPTSFLVLTGLNKSAAFEPDRNRLIGRARHYKGYSLALLCSQSGVEEKKLLKRQSKEMVVFLKKNKMLVWIP